MRVLDTDILSGLAPGGRPGSQVAEHVTVTCAPRAGPVVTVRIGAQRARPREPVRRHSDPILCTEDRVTVCDLGGSAIEAAGAGLAAEYALPCRRPGTSGVYGRYIGGPAAGSFRRFRATGFRRRYWRRLRIVSTAWVARTRTPAAASRTAAGAGGGRSWRDLAYPMRDMAASFYLLCPRGDAPSGVRRWSGPPGRSFPGGSPGASRPGVCPGWSL